MKERGKVMLFTKGYHIDWGDIDFKKELRLSILFSLFQDASSDASAELGFSIDRLEKEFHVAWILMKMRVDLIRSPYLGETITIETWPLEPGRSSFDRDFIVKDTSGHVIAKANSTWVIMNLENRKIDRRNKVGIHYDATISQRAIDSKFRRLKASDSMQTVYQKMIGYSDTDFNGHLNNAKYIDYMMDCFDIAEHKKRRVNSIEVHFTNEALPGETIVLQRDDSNQDENEFYIEGMKQETNEVIFKSKLIVEQE